MRESRRFAMFLFRVSFAVLTLLCWCPIGYGRYGVVNRIYGIPEWAAFLIGFCVLLFLVEMIYLFLTDFSLKDDDLDTIMTDLSSLDLADRHRKAVKHG